jgi:hypothetical protein
LFWAGYSGSLGPGRNGAISRIISGNGRPSYRQFRRWTLLGLWETLLEALSEAGGIGESVR